MGITVLLLLGGVVALGLPHVTRRSEARLWHSWLHSGLLPLVLGLMAAPLIEPNLQQKLVPVLVLVVAAAGVLAGTQLRLAFLRAAGAAFLRRHSVGSLILFHGAALLAFTVLLIGGEPFGLAVAWSGCIGALAVATSQRPPTGSRAFDVHHRDVVTGHVAPSGWWNLVALIGAATALALTLDQPPLWQTGVNGGEPLFLAPTWLTMVGTIGIPLGLGLALGWLAKHAANRDEAYLFTLSVLAVSGGAALVLGSNPLFSGLLVGLVFANVALGRASLIERAFEGLEQPVVVAIGLLAGLITGVHAAAWDVWALIPVLVLGRWLGRGRLSPTSSILAGSSERRLAPAGACAVVIIGALACMQDQALPLVPIVALAILVHTAVHAWFEYRSRHPIV